MRTLLSTFVVFLVVVICDEIFIWYIERTGRDFRAVIITLITITVLITGAVILYIVCAYYDIITWTTV